MQSSNVPDKISVPFADAGQKQIIPVDSQVGIEDARASYEDGFPPLTRTPLAAGGKPPFGTDMNGILYAITVIQQWQSAGGMFKYDLAFSTAINGYPKGALLLKADGSGYWQNTVENNTSDPDASGAGWIDFTTAALASLTGAVQSFARSTAPTGWLKCNGAAVSRTTYSALFAVIGTTFGAGDGSTTFNLPELRAEFIRGIDDGRGIIPSLTLGVAQGQTIQAHSHPIKMQRANGTGSTPMPAVNGGNNNFPFNANGESTLYSEPTGTTDATGSTETRPRNVGLLYCIKT
jgi:microcystin-dependent protein